MKYLLAFIEAQKLGIEQRWRCPSVSREMQGGGWLTLVESKEGAQLASSPLRANLRFINLCPIVNQN